MPPAGQMDSKNNTYFGYKLLGEVEPDRYNYIPGERYVNAYRHDGTQKTCCTCAPEHLMTHEEAMKQWELHMWQIHKDEKYNPKKRSHVGNGRHNGLWAGTLTKAPTDPISEADMIAAINKLMAQKTCPVKRYAWYLEYKEDGRHPHIHFIYETETGGRITQRTFQRVWSIWDEKKEYHDEKGRYKGHRGGYHKAVADEYAYNDYISEDGGLHGTKGFVVEDGQLRIEQ